jgi:hypothetical protein
MKTHGINLKKAFIILAVNFLFATAFFLIIFTISTSGQEQLFNLSAMKKSLPFAVVSSLISTAGLFLIIKMSSKAGK